MAQPCGTDTPVCVGESRDHRGDARAPPAGCAGGVFCVPFRLPTRAHPPRSHSRCTNQSMITILLLLALHAPEDSVLKARYIAVEGTDAEYGQGAIERNELLHHPLPHLEWLILTDVAPAELQSKLNSAVDPKHGSFIVDCASDEEEQAVRSGKIAMQR